MDIALEHSTIAPYLTFLISTHNRQEVLLRTLSELREVDHRCGLVTETIVVDNASNDGTADAVESEFPEVELIRLSRDLGVCAKNAGLQRAAGEFIVFLDDDSYPTAGSIRRMVELFQNDSHLGAAVFNVTLPDGSPECSAYPTIIMNCGTGFRRQALLEAGALPTNFFGHGEEYDLSLRLLNRRWIVRRFDDLQIRHLNTPAADEDTRTTRLNMRNNLMIVTRYFPRQWVLPYALDWARRHFWIAKNRDKRHVRAVAMGLIQGIVQSLMPRHRKPVGLAAFEEFAMVVGIRRRLEQAVRLRRFRSIVLIDVGENILPVWLAAKACGLNVVAIADTKLAAPGRLYHGVPVVTDEDAEMMTFDAAVVANMSPVQSAVRAQAWRKHQRRPVIDLFEPSLPVSKAA